MAYRAPASGISLSEKDVAIVKGMLTRGDRQHDIASWFGVNGGRIGEISTGVKFGHVEPAPSHLIPPPGPYIAGKESAILVQAISKARKALDEVEIFVQGSR